MVSKEQCVCWNLCLYIIDGNVPKAYMVKLHIGAHLNFCGLGSLTPLLHLSQTKDGKALGR